MLITDHLKKDKRLIRESGNHPSKKKRPGKLLTVLTVGDDSNYGH